MCPHTCMYTCIAKHWERHWINLYKNVINTHIVIQLCINSSNICILLVRISYVIWPSNLGIFRKINFIFTFSLQFLLFYFFHLPLTMTWISYLDCQLIASWQNCSSLAAFDQKMIWIDTLVSLLVMGIDFYRFRENQNFKDM